MEVLELLIYWGMALITLLVAVVAAVFYESKGARAGYSEREKQIDMERMAYRSDNLAKMRESTKLKDALGESDAQRVTAERAAAATGARLSDLRNWEKAVKRFFSALKGSNASDRTVLCKDPEGVIEKLLEGKSFIDLDELEVMRDRKPSVHEVLDELDQLELADAKVRLKTLKAEKKSLLAENERLRARVKELEASQ